MIHREITEISLELIFINFLKIKIYYIIIMSKKNVFMAAGNISFSVLAVFFICLACEYRRNPVWM